MPAREPARVLVRSTAAASSRGTPPLGGDAATQAASAATPASDGGRAAASLCRLPMVRAGLTSIPREEVILGSTPTGLSEAGRRELRWLTHYWEWADAVVSSPLRGRVESLNVNVVASLFLYEALRQRGRA